MSEIILTNENFSSEVIDSDKPVLVDFWASWCMPCKMLGPIIEEVAGEFDGKVKVCKLNVDEAGETASKYSIMSIPAVLIFKDGEVVEKLIGLRQKQEYVDTLNKYLEN